MTAAAGAHLKSIVDAWTQFELPELHTKLESVAAAIISQQEQGDHSKRLLIEKSRDFKQETGEDVRRVAAPLLKTFQGEIDSLSTRARHAESAFLDLYRKIIQVPDPTASLQTALTLSAKAAKVTDLELEVVNLRRTLNQYNDELTGVKNQEVTVRQLRDRLRQFEASVDQKVEERLREREQQLRDELAEREATILEEQSMRDAKLADAERRVRHLQTAMDGVHNELNTLRTAQDDADELRQRQMDMLERDIEEAVQRADRAEAELAAAGTRREAQTQAVATSANDASYERAAIDAELRAKDKHISQLMAQVTQQNSRLADQEQSHIVEIGSVRDELAATKQQIDELRTRERAMADYDELKRELSILKSIEFGSETDDVTKVESGKTLESLLLAKSKHLQSECAQLRNANTHVQGHSQLLSDMNGPSIHDKSSCSLTDNHTVNAGDAGNSAPAKTYCIYTRLPSNGDMANASEADIEESIKNDMNRLLARNLRLIGEHPLDTVVVSRECKNLLAVHNIGQRVFAKLILSQSQGSLSELLSKSKPWPQLTERGRESFRRIAAWQCDEECVEMLVAYVKRKLPVEDGSNGVGAQATQPIQAVDMDIMYADDQQQHNHGRCTADSPAPSFVRTNDSLTASCGGELSSVPPLLYKGRTISGASLSRAHSNEPTLLTQRCSSRQRSPNHGASINPRWQHDDIPKDKILEIYQRELAKLKEQEHVDKHHSNGGVTRSAEQLNDPLRTVKIDSPILADDTASSPPSTDSHAGKYSRQQTTPIALHTNVRSHLPAISQQQIDVLTDVDTDKVVSEVRDMLVAHSISQRLFGEHVLGLSQGSVSDLLARPKPWPMLTTKGKEPFVRMLMFMKQRDVAIQRLNAIKAIGSGGHDTSIMTNSMVMFPRDSDTTVDGTQLTASENKSPPKRGSNTFIVKHTMDNEQHEQQQSSSGGNIDLSTQAVMSFTGELDPIAIAAQIREQLQLHGIGQKVFGEKVLGVSQGTVSDLLSKTKAWPSLSTRGREPYIRMYLWLERPLDDRLKRITDGPNLIAQLQCERSSAGYNSSANGAPSQVASHNDFLFDEYNEVNTDSPLASHRKRSFVAPPTSDDGDSEADYPATKKFNRSVVTDEQRSALRCVFARNAYPPTSMIEQIASAIGLSSRTVTNWFYNQRCRKRVHTTLPPNGDSLCDTFPQLACVLGAPARPASDDDTTPPDQWHMNIMRALSAFAERHKCDSLDLTQPTTGDDGLADELPKPAVTVTTPSKSTKSLDFALAKMRQKVQQQQQHDE